MQQALNPLLLAGIIWTACTLGMAAQMGWQEVPAPRRPGAVLRAAALSLLRVGRMLAFTLLIGWLGGMLCGFAILLFGDYMGRSGSMGTQYFGYWDPESAWFVARAYGSLVGALIFPAFYLQRLRNLPLARWSALVPFAVAGTLGGGWLGALAGPPAAVLCGGIGFWFTTEWAVRRFQAATEQGAEADTAPS